MIFKTLFKTILKDLSDPKSKRYKYNNKSKRYEYNEYTYNPYALDYCTAHYIYDIPDDIDDI